MATVDDLSSLLRDSELTVHGRLLDSSNNALVVEIDDPEADQPIKAVYKPAAGERPLWDFPDTELARREVAAFDLARALRWTVVPPTVWRDAGPAGPGMCQLWIDTESTSSYVNLFATETAPVDWHAILEGRDEHDEPVVFAHSDSDDLRRLVAFDVIANNADRKAGHLLTNSSDGEIELWGIDHGLTFHTDPKLRTVFWGFAGEPLPHWLSSELAEFVAKFAQVAPQLAEHLSPAEVRATAARAEALLTAGEFPRPLGEGPAVPWPVF